MANKQKSAVDAALREEEGLFFGGDNLAGERANKKAKVSLGLTRLSVARPRQGGVVKGAIGVRAKIGQIVKRTPEVMVKITGTGKGMGHIAAHMRYISRDGELKGGIEDQDGMLFEGKESLKDLQDIWRNSGFITLDSPEEQLNPDSPDNEGGKKRAGARDAYNLVLSMPTGTDPVQLMRAARDFAAQEFAGHDYIMALHTPDNEPDRKKSEENPRPNHPHVHLTVKARDREGFRINPKKADLQRWRENFAAHLNAHGVAAAATRRVQRLKRTYAEKQSVRYMKDRGEQLTAVGNHPIDPKYIEKAIQTDAKIRSSYERIASELAQSEDVRDRQLAADLVHTLAELSNAKDVPTRTASIQKAREDDNGKSR
jgi:hypothetical protein